ncbi:hypothetical protein ITP53_42750 [Nonomuraea sp. K274]|uniref:DUF1453 domain-containing protein n=1 Tax=Nonomuraea cypriaca TaxID=1187855 RepID=A0A931F5L9_9ACTN|nr:hypothetical protein [Nonomuraea cypriaca]MBF8192293.1 hypothetical protein [Nonomuraea cypriaca]
MEPIQISLLILLVTAFVIYRQLRVRPTAGSAVLYTAAIMIGIGVVSGGLIDDRHLAVSVAMLLVEAGSAVALGAWRAATVRVWMDDSGVTWSKATGWTMLVWLASIASRVGLYFAGDYLGLTLSTGGILLFVGLTLGAQSYLVARRGRALTGAARRPDNFVR